MLDVPSPGAHDIIGDRAYASDPDRVASLGAAAAAGLLAGGVLPVMKHVPGHGRAGADSHEALPRVSASLDELRACDFRPFRALAGLPVAMTAHVVYEAVDPDRPATTSHRVIADVVRGEIGFDGLLLTDDLSMKALSGSFRSRAEAAFRAGLRHRPALQRRPRRNARGGRGLAQARRRHRPTRGGRARPHR